MSRGCPWSGRGLAQEPHARHGMPSLPRDMVTWGMCCPGMEKLSRSELE